MTQASHEPLIVLASTFRRGETFTRCHITGAKMKPVVATNLRQLRGTCDRCIIVLPCFVLDWEYSYVLEHNTVIQME